MTSTEVGNYPISQGYGPSPYSFEPIVNGQHFHTGVDLQIKSGTALFDHHTGNAEVLFAGEDGGYGGRVVLLFENGVVETFNHLREIIVHKGQIVSTGQELGYTGGDAKDPMHGNSTGAHLHWEYLIPGSGYGPNESQWAKPVGGAFGDSLKKYMFVDPLTHDTQANDFTAHSDQPDNPVDAVKGALSDAASNVGKGLMIFGVVLIGVVIVGIGAYKGSTSDE